MIWILIFIFGALVGSFLNCVIYRLETKEGFVKGRSRCPCCKKEINPRDLVPVLSFFLLKGRCRDCQGKISWQYPLVEIITGAIFLLIFNFQLSPVVERFAFTTGQAIFNQFSIFNFQDFLTTTYLLLIACFLIIIFVYDLKYYIIPDQAVLGAIGTVLTWQTVSAIAGIMTFSELFSFLLAGIGASGFFLVIFLLSKGTWIGFGDVKLAIFMGIFLGFPQIITAFFLSFILGAIIGMIMILLKKKNIKSEIPFAPFLIFGTALAFFWGEEILRWYLDFFLL